VAEGVIAHTSHPRSRWKNSPYGHCRSPRPIAAFPARASWAQGSPAEPFHVDAVKMAIYPHLTIHLTTRAAI
jgi:hypothetical protein